MTKCPECRIAPLRKEDGTCRYCDRTKARVVPGRVPMDGVLKTFVVATIAANAVVFGFRALIYVLEYPASRDLNNGDLTALDKIHRYHTWGTIDLWATVVSGVLLGRLLRQWMDAGNANALTRADIGLGWFRGMPSSKAFQRWQWGQVFGYFSIVFLAIFVFRSPAHTTSQVLGRAALFVALCSVVIASSIAAAHTAREMTAQLLERLDTEPAPLVTDPENPRILR